MIIARRGAALPAAPVPRMVTGDCNGGIMTDRTYRVTEIVGTSTEGVEPAIRNALHRAAQTLRHLDWFEVTQIRGQIEDGRVAHYQVGIKLGFRLEDD
jgi:dodecin